MHPISKPIRTIAHVLLPLFVALVLLQSSAALTAPATQSEHTLTQATSYPIVDTGQTACYDDAAAIACPGAGAAFAGQDSQIDGHQPAYTANGDGTVSDSVTGLMWQQSPDTNGDGSINSRDKLAYADAVSYCEDLSLAAYTDWTLPTIKQLYSLIDFRGTDPAPQATDDNGLVPFINTDYFAFTYGDTSAGERIIDAQYASATLYGSTVALGRGETQAMFGVNFADGRIKGYPTTGIAFWVQCVRGNSSYGQNAFIDNGDGTITDAATGLMWAQDDSGTSMNWEEALAYAAERNAANHLGYNDWRLPNAKELQSIVDYTRTPDTTGSAAIDPLFNITSFTNEAGETDYPYYWSSTTHTRWNGAASDAAYVAFGRALGYIDGTYYDVHGAGAQRSDPKSGDPAALPLGMGPQGDVQRINNAVRLVRDADGVTDTEPAANTATIYLPYIAQR
jgi:hypothetical protein